MQLLVVIFQASFCGSKSHFISTFYMFEHRIGTQEGGFDCGWTAPESEYLPISSHRRTSAPSFRCRHFLKSQSTTIPVARKL
jgi:hypothetical protein